MTMMNDNRGEIGLNDDYAALTTHSFHLMMMSLIPIVTNDVQYHHHYREWWHPTEVKWLHLSVCWYQQAGIRQPMLTEE
jgi:hypothetical protein